MQPNSYRRKSRPEVCDVANDEASACWSIDESDARGEELDGMTLLRNFKRMGIKPVGDAVVLHVGDMDIWDGADLALLREGLTLLIEKEKCRHIVIDMTHVKYIPSGFFGMMVDWQEKRDVSFGLTPPQPNVQAMLWFRQFFRRGSDGNFNLSAEPLREELPNLSPEIEACLVHKR